MALSIGTRIARACSNERAWLLILISIGVLVSIVGIEMVLWYWAKETSFMVQEGVCVKSNCHVTNHCCRCDIAFFPLLNNATTTTSNATSSLPSPPINVTQCIGQVSPQYASRCAQHDVDRSACLLDLVKMQIWFGEPTPKVLRGLVYSGVGVICVLMIGLVWWKTKSVPKHFLSWQMQAEMQWEEHVSLPGNHKDNNPSPCSMSNPYMRLPVDVMPATHHSYDDEQINEESESTVEYRSTQVTLQQHESDDEEDEISVLEWPADE